MCSDLTNLFCPTLFLASMNSAAFSKEEHGSTLVIVNRNIQINRNMEIGLGFIERGAEASRPVMLLIHAS